MSDPRPMHYIGTLPTKFPPPESGDAAAHAAMLAHIAGGAPAEVLESDLDNWRRLLVHHNGRVAGLLSGMKSEADVKERACRTSQDWLDWHAQWSQHRSLVVEHMGMVQAAVSFVNQLRREYREDRLERLELRVLELERWARKESE